MVGVSLSAADHAGVVLAAEEINAAGGLRGLALEIAGLEHDVGGGGPVLNEPSGTDPLDSVRAYPAMPEVVAVVGPNNSSAALAVAPFLDTAHVPTVLTVATHPVLTNAGRWVYRLCVSDAAQGPALARYAVTTRGKKRVAVFFTNDNYGWGLAQSFQRAVWRLGGEVVSSTKHQNALTPADKENLRDVLAGFKKSSLPPEVVVLFQRASTGNWTVKAIREAGLDVEILGGDSLAIPGFYADDVEGKEGVRISTFFFERDDNAVTRGFVERFAKRWGHEPTYGEAFAYDAVALVGEAVRERGPSREGVRAHLDGLVRTGTVVNGVAGPFSIGPDHDARREFYLVEIRGGRLRYVQSLEAK